MMLSWLLLLVADTASAISGSAPALTVISTQQFWSPPVDWFRLGSVCVIVCSKKKKKVPTAQTETVKQKKVTPITGRKCE